MPEGRLEEGACHFLATDGTLKTAARADRTRAGLSPAALPPTVASLAPAVGPVSLFPPHQPAVTKHYGSIWGVSSS